MRDKPAKRASERFIRQTGMRGKATGSSSRRCLLFTSTVLTVQKHVSKGRRRRGGGKRGVGQVRVVGFCKRMQIILSLITLS